MALVGNYSVLNKSPGRWRSGTTHSADRSNFSGTGSMKNRFLGDQSTGMAKYSAIPNGSLAPNAWALPQSSGGMATYKSISAAFSTSSASLASGINLTAALSASINITNAQLSQIVSLVAALSASVGITNAQLAAVASISAAISANMSVTTAQLGAIAGMTAALSASGSLTNANVFATANLSADIGGATPLSPEGLAAAMLNSILADYNSAGSVGEALNNVGAAGNPWDATLAANNTAGTFGEQVQKLLTLAKYLGLK